MSSMRPVTLHFPSEQKILNYLEEDKGINYPFLEKTEIAEAVARFFADKKISSEEISREFWMALHDVSHRIQFPGFMEMETRLITALKNCAEANQVK